MCPLVATSDLLYGGPLVTDGNWKEANRFSFDALFEAIS